MLKKRGLHRKGRATQKGDSKSYGNLKKLPKAKKEPPEKTRLDHTEIAYRSRNVTQNSTKN